MMANQQKMKGKEKQGPSTEEEKFKCIDCCKPNYSVERCIEKEHRVMHMKDFHEMNAKKLNKITVHVERFPYKHEKSDLIVTTDAAYNKHTRVACLAVVLRSSSLDYLFGILKVTKIDNPFGGTENIIAEADGIAFGIETALKYVKENKGKYKKIKVYSDCNAAVDAYNSGRTTFPEYENAKIPLPKVNEMRSKAGVPHWVGVKKFVPGDTRKPEVPITMEFVHRVSNLAADYLGGTGASRPWPTPFEQLQIIIKEDKFLTRYHIPRQYQTGATSQQVRR